MWTIGFVVKTAKRKAFPLPVTELPEWNLWETSFLPFRMLRLGASLAKTKPSFHFRHFHPSTSTRNSSQQKPPPTNKTFNEQESKRSPSNSESSQIIDSDQSSLTSSTSTTTSRTTPSLSKPLSPANSESEDRQPRSLDELKEKLLKWVNDRAFHFRRRADNFTGATKVRLSGLGAELNKVTGYEEIDALKRQVVEQGTIPPPVFSTSTQSR